MAGWTQTVVLGNLGSDPELRYLPSGAPVCTFNVAVNEVWTDRQSNERREKTVWFRVSAWNQLAETCSQYLAKGRQVMVIGTVEARGYTNNSGEAAASLELRARDVRFVGSRDGGGSGGEGGRGDYNDFAPPPDDVGDIPF